MNVYAEIARMEAGWRDPPNVLLWCKIADAYLDVGDYEKEELWRGRVLRWRSIMRALSHLVSTESPLVIGCQQNGYKVTFQRYPKTIRVWLHTPKGWIPPDVYHSFQGSWWRLGSKNPRYLIDKALDLLVALEEPPRPFVRWTDVEPEKGERK